MIGHDRTELGAWMALLTARGLTPARLGALVDDLTHTTVPPALRRVPPAHSTSTRRTPLPRKKISKIEFDGPATINDLIEALTELRDEHGGDTVPRFTAVIEFNLHGQRVAGLTVVPGDAR